ncbi:serine protease AprX [Prauserella shujinwangii]|uniref:Serine protease AprX n=1 Tax=Prauserella shujinwangii TaxID=1453103 RepID=A0A2T0LWT0_9PSEU|nr:S8 family serine peptidase [Prauserella shujinwangii]PRX48457.1 serine protease AprX [Prauserella shujinwangii]
MRPRPSRMRRSVLVAASVIALPLAGAVPAAAQQADPLAPVSDTLEALLGSASGVTPVTALVHGTDLAAATAAVRDAGLSPITSFRRIGVVAASGTASQVRQVRASEGVTYVENNDPLRMFASTGTAATRSAAARTTLTGANGQPLDGRGVSVAVIDTGVDPTHPAFRGPDGSSRVVANLKSLCAGSGTGTGCVVRVPNTVDTDTLSLGGHGTHVTGIAAGRAMTLSGGTEVGGSAPGAKIVSISTGAALVVLGADAALNWVLENHEAPCGAGVPAAQCPPIKVVNNSYGPSGGGDFDPNSATVKLQRALAAEGVVTVWANGNDGGDGSQNLSNPPGQDPTPGVLSVASYNDQGTGTRDGTVSDFSSRGLETDPRSWPDISAPGENILSACRPYLVICSTGLQPVNGPGLLDIGTYNVISGTSMAAPQITGIVAQLFQAKPAATPGEIEDALKSTAYKYADGAPYQQAGGYTSSFDKGTGLVDTVAAATLLGARPAA